MMEFSNNTRSLTSVLRDIRKGKYNLHPVIQRKNDAWNRLQKSYLIVSLIENMPTNIIYCRRCSDGTLEVIDGLQRLTTYMEFMNDEFSLHKNTPPVTIEKTITYVDGTKRKQEFEYEIATKKFSALDEELQDELKAASMLFCDISNATDDNIKQLFLYLNNGTSLTASTKANSIIDTDCIKILREIAEHPFVSKTAITKRDRTGDRDRDIIVQAIVLLHDNMKKEYEDFTINNIYKYIDKNIEINTLNEYKSKIIEIMDYLDNCFEKRNLKLKKVDLPFILFFGCKCLDDGKDINDYLRMVCKFVDTIEVNEKYQAFIINMRKVSVDERFDYFKEYMYDCVRNANGEINQQTVMFGKIAGGEIVRDNPEMMGKSSDSFMNEPE